MFPSVKLRESSGSQKFSFNPNCSTRLGSPIAMTVAELGSDVVLQQVWPNSELLTRGVPELALRGLLKLG